MKITRWPALVALALVGAACQDTPGSGIAAPPAAKALAAMPRTSQVAGIYAADLVATAASGFAMNDLGDVVGTSYQDTGCGPFCLPPQETVVWRGGNRIVLPPLPGFAWPGLFPQAINNQGWIGGYVGSLYSNTKAVVWRPSGSSYTITDVGLLPRTKMTMFGGMDNAGRVVGWALDAPVIPTVAAPFLWTDTGGIVDLATQGYPNDRPIAMSPNGRVATFNFTYQLGNPASAVPMPAPPRGFVGFGNSVVNDAGDRALFLGTTSSQNLAYLFRLPAGTNAWQQLSPAGTGHLSRYGLGSINSALDVTATILSSGVIAAGPAGLAQDLSALLSPAYGGAVATLGGPMNANGDILSQFIIGRSSRLMRLVPTAPCGANCVKVNRLQMVAKFVQDPAHPGSCFQGGKMHNDFGVRVTVTDEVGTLLRGAVVKGRFLDDYWMDMKMTGTTNAKGYVDFKGSGPCGVGAIAFFVDNVSATGRTFDRTTGTLTIWKIPQ